MVELFVWRTVLCYSGDDVDGLSNVLPPRSFGEQVELLVERLRCAALAAASDGSSGRVGQTRLVRPLRIRRYETGHTLHIALISNVQHTDCTQHKHSTHIALP